MKVVLILKNRNQNWENPEVGCGWDGTERGSQPKFSFNVKMLNNIVSVLVEMVISGLFAVGISKAK